MADEPRPPLPISPSTPRLPRARPAASLSPQTNGNQAHEKESPPSVYGAYPAYRDVPTDSLRPHVASSTTRGVRAAVWSSGTMLSPAGGGIVVGASPSEPVGAAAGRPPRLRPVPDAGTVPTGVLASALQSPIMPFLRYSAMVRRQGADGETKVRFAESQAKRRCWKMKAGEPQG